MNALPKSNSSGNRANVPQNSSFMTAPVENITNSIKNMAANISEPIKESFNSAVEGSETSPYVSIPLILTIGVLIILFIIAVMFREQIVMGLQLAWQKLKDLFGVARPAVDPPAPAYVPDLPPQPQTSAIEKMLPGKKEVFNIAQDKYTYSDAEPLCKAYGAELATYDQVKEAWNKGADWCNYGWIKGQSAVYPTQQATYDKLQMGPEDQRMSCGVPGVNGGFFDNPELRFGVNCYGKKPAENDADDRYLMNGNHNLTPDAIEYDNKVQEYKTKFDDIPVNPFKKGSWSS